MKNLIKPVSQKRAKIILDQMKNSVYEIYKKYDDFKIGIGFFCYIKYKNKNIPVLVMNCIDSYLENRGNISND